MSNQRRVPPSRIAIALGCLLCLAALLRLAMALILPFGQSVALRLEGLNDEPAHYNYVKFLATQRSFPVLTHWGDDPGTFVRNDFEYHQPPLYYAACVPLYWWLGEHALLMCRVLSVLLGVAGLWVLASLIRELGHPVQAQLGAVAFFALCFPHVYFTSVVSNDAASWLLALLLTREMLRYGALADASWKGARWRLIAMGGYLGAGLLTKSSFLVFMPVILGVFAHRFFATRAPAHLRNALFVLGVGGLLALPWYGRNIALYHSILGIPVAADQSLAFQEFLGLAKGTLRYFWFPMQHLAGGSAAFAWMMAIGAGLLAVHAALALRWLLERRRWTEFAPGILLLLLAANAVAYVWYVGQWRNPEARLLFPALGSIAVLGALPAHRAFVGLRIERLWMAAVVSSALWPYVFLVWVR